MQKFLVSLDMQLSVREGILEDLVNPKNLEDYYKIFQDRKQKKEIYLPFALLQALRSSFPGDSCPRKSNWFAFDSNIPTNLNN